MSLVKRGAAVGVVEAMLAGLCFATLWLFIKLGHMLDISFINLVRYRFIGGTIALWLLLACFRVPFIMFSGTKMRFLGLLGILRTWGVVLPIVFAAKWIPASTGILVVSTYPIFVMLLELITGVIKFKRTMIATFALVMLGCFLICQEATSENATIEIIGILFFSTISWAIWIYLSSYMLRQVDSAACDGRVRGITIGGDKAIDEAIFDRWHPVVSAFWMYLFGALSLLIYPGDYVKLFNSTSPISVHVELILGLAVITVVAASILQFDSFRRIGATYGTLFANTEIIGVMLMGVFCLHETIMPVKIVGALLVLAGIFFPNRSGLNFTSCTNKLQKRL